MFFVQALMDAVISIAKLLYNRMCSLRYSSFFILLFIVPNSRQPPEEGQNEILFGDGEKSKEQQFEKNACTKAFATSNGQENEKYIKGKTWR